MADENLKNLTDLELAEEITRFKNEIEGLLTQLALYQALIANMEAEQERRKGQGA